MQLDEIDTTFVCTRQDHDSAATFNGDGCGAGSGDHRGDGVGRCGSGTMNGDGYGDGSGYGTLEGNGYGCSEGYADGAGV